MKLTYCAHENMSDTYNCSPEESILGLTESWVPSRQTHFPIISVYDDG